MKKETPFLDFYYRCMEYGSIQNEVLRRSPNTGGLCSTILNRHPVFRELKNSVENGRDGFWGHDCADNWFVSIDDLRYEFTPTRQNIVLLCAAINGEL